MFDDARDGSVSSTATGAPVRGDHHGWLIDPTCRLSEVPMGVQIVCSRQRGVNSNAVAVQMLRLDRWRPPPAGQRAGSPDVRAPTFPCGSTTISPYSPGARVPGPAHLPTSSRATPQSFGLLGILSGGVGVAFVAGSPRGASAAGSRFPNRGLMPRAV